jgi:hypothetical protein
LDLQFWIASPAFSGLLAIPLVALLKRIDMVSSLGNSATDSIAGSLANSLQILGLAIQNRQSEIQN